MSSIVEALIEAYPEEARVFVRPTNKEKALRYVRGLAATIEEMEDFDHFPDGEMGVVMYAVLESVIMTVTDVGDFGYVRQGCEQALRASFDVLATRIG